ncbi:MAG: ferric reductase-like transmembrane domain-containing protein [Pseudomonadota bacterium]
MIGLRALGLWGAVLLALAVPVVLSLVSPLLVWRDPVYIIAGLAGVLAMGVLLLQPLLAMGLLPGLSGARGRRLHRWTGASLVVLIVLHVLGLWLTSPPDVIDALTFTSPTPFTPWGVVAMWAVFGAALLALFRKRLRPRHWRRIHTALAAVIVVGSVVHAMLIEGTMEFLTKSALCALVLVATALAVSRVWKPRPR